jgi:hypothetical protein
MLKQTDSGDGLELVRKGDKNVMIFENLLGFHIKEDMCRTGLALGAEIHPISYALCVCMMCI